MCSSSRAPEGGVDAGHRLVEQQHARSRHQRARELEQLALPAREHARVLVREPFELEDLEQLHRRVPDLALTARAALGRKTRLWSRSPGWSGAASIMLSITGIRASAFVIWKVRTMPSRAITCGGRRKISPP